MGRRGRKIRSSAKQIRNAYRVLAMRASNLVPRHLRRNLKGAATEGATKLRQIRRRFRRILRWKALLRKFLGRIAGRRISRWLVGWETGRQPKKLRRWQQHCPLAERAADLLPSIGRVNLNHAPAERALH